MFSSNSTPISVYNRVLALYTYEGDKLTSISGKKAKLVQENWGIILDLLKADPTAEMNEFGVIEHHLKFPESFIDGISQAEVFEVQCTGESQIRGMICLALPEEREFDLWFIGHVLSHTSVGFAESPASQTNSTLYTDLITTIFEEELRNITADDKWEHQGKAYFQQVVRFFTTRNLKIEACLPAFPCKSHNTQKVAGTLPDKGEELALRQLVKVAKQINEIYPPGIKVWIVSDGHVFSDCSKYENKTLQKLNLLTYIVGADDGDVDEYGSHLRSLAESIATKDILDFMALPDVFSSKMHKFQESYIQHMDLPHYLNTQIDPESEVCRKIMMASCHTDDTILRELIDQQDPVKLALYRGFRKFMEEDLAMNPVIKGLSRSAKKKLCGKVAFEMIKRNEAYSNLVELMYPFHLRLSIHAHCNSGPKFGIRLLSNKSCKIIRSLKDSDATPVFEDLLHIPTPWHNCVIKVKNEDNYFIGKSEVALKAISKGLYGGVWVAGDISAGKGGYFSIWQLPSLETENIPIQVGKNVAASAV